MDELISQLINYLKGAWKYRWPAMILAWTISFSGWIYVFQLPDSYSSSARIYVDTQSILRPLMAGMALTPNVEQQVSIMSRTLFSRPNLEKVLRMVDLDIKAGSVSDHEKLLDTLSDNIKIESTGRNDLYLISGTNENPKIAKDIVQALLTIFVEGSIGDKKQDSTTAINFIDQQINEYEEKLVAAENALKEFRRENIGILPSEGTDYTVQMLAIEDNLEKAKLELSEAEQSRDTIKKRISGDEPTLPNDEDVNQSDNPELDARIAQQKDKLDTLRLNFTEQHPDVIATKRLIGILEKRKAEEAKLPKNKHDPGKNYSPMLQQLYVDLSQAESTVAGLKARVAEYSRRHEELRAKSNAILEMEANLARLNRDYTVYKSNYEKLVERREAAKLSDSLRDTSELMTFKIIDPPTTPLLPTGPNRLKLNSMVMLAGLAAAIGLAFVVSQIRPTFNSQGDLREATGLVVLGEITRITTDKEKIRNRKNLYAFGLSFIALLIVYALLLTKVMLM